jgi:hypothetical protein
MTSLATRLATIRTQTAPPKCHCGEHTMHPGMLRVWSDGRSHTLDHCALAHHLAATQPGESS